MVKSCFRYISVCIFFLFLIISNFTNAQSSAIDLYKKAQENYNSANYSQTINLALQAKNKLGETNPKIEALLSQAYYNNGNIINAKVAYNKLLKLTPNSTKHSDNFKPFLELGKQIEEALQKEEKEFKNNKNKKKEEKVNRIINQYRQKNQRKINSIKNGSRGEDFFMKKVIDEADNKAYNDLIKTFKKFSRKNLLLNRIKERKKELGEIGYKGEKKSGYKHGLWKYYWTNGELQQEVNYNYGKRLGTHKFYFDKNYISTRDKSKVYFYRTLNYSNSGVLNLFFEERYYKTNNLKFSSFFKEDNDKVKNASLYFSDLQLKVKFYFENGNLQFESPIKNGKYNGLAKRYYDNGKLWQKINYVNHKAEGSYESYYKNGKKNQEIIFKNNKPFTYLQGFIRNGSFDNESNLKNGNGKIFLRNYYPVYKNEFKHIQNLYNFDISENEKLYSIERNYNNSNLTTELITLQFKKFQKTSYDYLKITYANNKISSFINYYDKTLQYFNNVNIYSGDIEHRILYHPKGKIQDFWVLNKDKKILNLTMTNWVGREKEFKHTALIIKKQHKNGLIKSIFSYPKEHYAYSDFKGNDKIVITKNNGKKKELKLKRDSYIRDYVFNENGLLHDIIIRKRKNEKEIGRVYNTKRNK